MDYSNTLLIKTFSSLSINAKTTKKVEIREPWKGEKGLKDGYLLLVLSHISLLLCLGECLAPVPCVALVPADTASTALQALPLQLSSA